MVSIFERILASVAMVGITSIGVSASAALVRYDFLVPERVGGNTVDRTGFFVFDNEAEPNFPGTLISGDIIIDFSFTWGDVTYDESMISSGFAGYWSTEIDTISRLVFGVDCAPGGGACNVTQGSGEWLLLFDFPTNLGYIEFTRAGLPGFFGTVFSIGQPTPVPLGATLPFLVIGIASFRMVRPPPTT